MFKEFLQQAAKSPNGEKVRLLKTTNKFYSDREGQCFMLQKPQLGDHASLTGFERGGLTNTIWEAGSTIHTGPITKIHENGRRIVLETEQATYLFEKVPPEEF